MLKKKERLTRKEFDRSFSVGKRIHSPFLQLVYEAGRQFHGSVVVGKKVAKKAVDRNRMRRRIYAIVYAFAQDRDLQLTLIIIAKPPFASLSRAEAADAVRQLLSRLPQA